MALPRVDQYQMALQNPTVVFRDPELKTASVKATPMGLPKVISGGFALTYQLTNGSRQWAVRCFHREARDLERRYAAISTFTASAGSPYLISVEYQPAGILVDGSWHPITKMPWLNAVPINRYIEANLSPSLVQRLAAEFKVLVADIAKRGVAHGDLQHGNILVDGSGSLKLVDYFGMFVPALQGMKASESGHPNYQHPLRQSQFDRNIDRFSILAITVALEAVAAKPDLWKKYSTGDNLLFKQSDFADPDSSPIFKELISLTATRTHAERLKSICLGGFDQVPTLDDFIVGKLTQRPIAVGPRAVRTPSEVFASSATGQLIAREGYIVTVVGQITALHRARTRYRQPYAFLNFGDYKTGCFTLVLWKEAIELFARLGADPDDYAGKWVSVTGLITVYRPRRRVRSAQPQMVINMPSEISVISAEEARDILGDRHQAPAKPSAAPATSKGAPTVRKTDADALNRFYKDFTSVPARTPPRRPSAPTPANRPAARRTVSVTSRGSPPGRKRDYWGLFWYLVSLGFIAWVVYEVVKAP